MNEQKVVGQPCPTCGTPYIMGRTGAYCKPCYIKWANANKPTQPKSHEQVFEEGLNKDQQDEKWEKIGQQKMRSILAVAYIRQNKSPIDVDVKDELESWEQYILGTK